MMELEPGKLYVVKKMFSAYEVSNGKSLALNAGEFVVALPLTNKRDTKLLFGDRVFRYSWNLNPEFYFEKVTEES